MKRSMISAILVLSGMFLVSQTLADHHMPSRSAVEYLGCTFNDDQSMDDLRDVSAKWEKWSKGKFSEDYTAFSLRPILTSGGDVEADYIWMGIAKNQEAMGRIKDEWFNKGQKMAAKFAEVSTCAGNGLMDSFVLKPYENMGEAGYIQINACEMNDGVTNDDIAMADAKWVTWMTENNMPVGAYRWVPSVGDARDSTTDFYNVYVAESLADRGKAHDMMYAGGFPVATELYGALYTCDNPRVWFAEPVGTVKAK
jgi:hypothetical protein